MGYSSPVGVMGDHKEVFHLAGGKNEKEVFENLEKNGGEEKIVEKNIASWKEEFKNASKFAQEYFLNFENFKNSSEAKKLIKIELEKNHSAENEEKLLSEFWNANY